MTPAERAKQFMPFAALKGYEEALRKVEREHEERMTKPAWAGGSESDSRSESDFEEKTTDFNQK